MKRSIVATVMSIGFVLTSRSATAQTKIAVIDTERAVLSTEDGQRAQATLKQLSETRQADLESRQKALQQDKDALDKETASGKTPKAVLQRKSDALQKRILEFQQSYTDSQNEVQKKRAELTQPIVDKMMGIVRSLAMQEGYDVVIDKGAVPYYRPEIELTNRAVQLYNVGRVAAPSAKPAANLPAAAPRPAPPRK